MNNNQLETRCLENIYTQAIIQKEAIYNKNNRHEET